MKTGLSRRSWMKMTAAGVTAGVWSALGSRSVGATTAGEPEIKIAGYDYDRVRAIVDGTVSLLGSRVAFDFQDIYSVNQSAFGPERKYEVTELGLIPYVLGRTMDRDGEVHSLPRLRSLASNPAIEPLPCTEVNEV